MMSLTMPPAMAFLFPAMGPFLLVLLFLLVFRKTLPGKPSVALPFSDLAVLAGLLLDFEIFDKEALRHFFAPDRPLDSIPLLIGIVFLLRRLFVRLPPLLPEATALFAGVWLLLSPILVRTTFFNGALETCLVFGLWGFLRLSFPVDQEKGLGGTFLIPLFLTSSALSGFSALSGSLLVGQISAGVAGVFGAILLAGRIGDVRPSAIEAGWTLGALLVIGRQYVDIDPVVIGSLVLSLILGATGGRLIRKRHPKTSRQGDALVTAFSLAPLIVTAVKTFVLSSDTGGY